MRDRIRMMMAFGAGLLVSLVVPAATGVASDQFQDVPTGHTFHDDIAWLADSGITKGCNPPANTLFCPEDPVTRGQMAAFLLRALDLPAAGDQGLTDTAGSVFKADIDALAAAGITKGCNPPANTMFCPNDEVTRGQMAAFLVRALNLPEAGDQGLTDTAGVFKTDIDALAAAGITKGCNPPTNTRFCPNDEVTRDQMAAFLNRALVEPSNGLIAFDSDRHGGDLDIFVMNPDGSGVRNLTANSAAADFEPAWSPNGSQIVFTSTRSGDNHLYLMDADGSGVGNLTAGLALQSFHAPTFTPDGSRIVFSAWTETTRFAIWSMDLDGSDLEVFEATADPTNHDYFDLEVSRDGRVIGFTQIILGIEQQFIDAHVLAFPDAGVEDPRAGPVNGTDTLFWDFSPDGSRIIFGFRNNPDPERDELDLWVVDSDRGTEGPHTNLTDTLPLDESAAAYAPDGTLVAFMRRPDQTSDNDIFIMNPDGTGARNLTNSPSNDRRPDWQPVR